MYNVDTKRIYGILDFFEGPLLQVLEEIRQQPQETVNKGITAFALSRSFHLIIEAMTDVGNLLIDGFIMRDPGSYEDIVDIMEDEKVYTKEQATAYKNIVSLRKALVIDYTNVNVDLYGLLQSTFPLLVIYPQLIREYLKNELW